MFLNEWIEKVHKIYNKKKKNLNPDEIQNHPAHSPTKILHMKHEMVYYQIKSYFFQIL